MGQSCGSWYVTAASWSAGFVLTTVSTVLCASQVNAMKLSPSAAALAGSSTPEFLPAPIVDPYKSAAAKSKEVTVAAAPKQPPAKAGGIGAATSVASASGGAPGKPPAAPTTSAGLAMEPVTEVRRARQVPQSRIGAAGSRGQAASRRAPGTPPGSRQGGRRTPTRSSPVPPARGASPAPQARSSSPAPPVVSDIAPGEAEAAAVRLQSMVSWRL